MQPTSGTVPCRQSDKVAYMAAEEARAGIKGEGSLAARYGVPKALMGAISGLHSQGRFNTTGEEDNAFAKALATIAVRRSQMNLFGLDKMLP